MTKKLNFDQKIGYFDQKMSKISKPFYSLFRKNAKKAQNCTKNTEKRQKTAKIGIKIEIFCQKINSQFLFDTIKVQRKAFVTANLNLISITNEFLIV